MTRILAGSMVTVWVLGLASAPAGAQQGQSATLVGTIRDATGGALADATVVVSSSSLIGGAQTATTDRTGAYRIAALTPGEYSVTATAPSFQSQVRRVVRLLPGATADVDFELLTPGVQESVTVNANQPLVDVHTSAGATVINRAVLDNLPLSRTVSDYVNLVPGVVGFFEIGVVAFGSANSSNPLMLDGANGNETGWGTPTITPSPGWIEQIQVVALGGDAQFGEYTGAPLNAMTRSGSNRFSGGADYWTTRSNWVADNRGTLTPALAARFRPLDVLERRSTTAQLGGPIATDKAWFFGGVDLYHNETRPAGFAAIASPPEDAVATLEEPKWLGKITGAPRPSIRVEAYVARDQSTSIGGNASPLVKPEALSAVRRPETLWSGRLTWTLSERTFVEVQHGGHDTHTVSGPRDPAAIAGPPGHYDTLTGVRSVNVTSYGDGLTRPINTALAVTHYAAASHGQSHSIKAGFEYEYDRLRAQGGMPGDMTFYDVNGNPDTVLIQAPATWRPDHQRQTVYVQDGWTATGRLTINAGLRFGFYQGAIAGHSTQFSAHSIAPRIGFAWDVLPTHTLAVRAHYGRYHDPMVTTFYDFLDPLSQPVFIAAQVVAPNDFKEISRSDRLAAYDIDPRLRYPYAEEWIAGIERSLPRNLSVTARYIGRRYGSIVGFVSLMDWTPVQSQDPGPDGVLSTSDDGGPVTLYENSASSGWRARLTNPNGAYKHYNGVQLIASRHGGLWQGQASYTWSRTRASFDNNFSSNAASNDLGDNGVFVNPNRALYDSGRTSYDFTHELKAIGTMALSWAGGVRVSGVYRLQSGMVWARRVSFPSCSLLQFCGGIAVEPRGAREAPAPNILDMRVEKSFRVGGPQLRSTIGVFADVFNATNQGVANRYFNVSGPNFGVPTSWSNPRILRAGVRFNF